MINFIKEQLAIRRLKKELRQYAQPDRVFLKSARLRFITLAKQKSGVSAGVGHYRSWKYATVAIVVVLSITGGVAGLADANNISATNPLYNFKRVSEQVRMGLSSPTKQVKLHKVFANRRLEEVVELTKENQLKKENAEDVVPTITVLEEVASVSIKTKTSRSSKKDNKNKIDRLNSDFEKEAEKTIDQAEVIKVSSEERLKICTEIVESLLQGPASSSARLANRIESRCQKIHKE